jgi:hypothetical protein
MSGQPTSGQPVNTMGTLRMLFQYVIQTVSKIKVVTRHIELALLLTAGAIVQVAWSQQAIDSAQAGARSAAGQAQPSPAAFQPAAPAAIDERVSPDLAKVVDTVIAREHELLKNLRKYSPRVETYIQDLRPDPELGTVPVNDHYFLGRMDFQRGVAFRSFLPQPGLAHRTVKGITGQITQLYSMPYQVGEFTYMIVIDGSRFDRQHYQLDFVSREFLGNVRCVVFDVQPRPGTGVGLFEGRIWAEDQEYNIVRFNGTYTPAPRFSAYFHFDSWRENIQPGLWFPVYVYSEELDLKYSIKRAVRFKSQTRLWGYDLSNPTHKQELTWVMVEAPSEVRDASENSTDPSPVSSQREWEGEAETNILERLEKAGLVAPPGDVDKVTETVVNNLIVTNHLANVPQIHVRILLTSTLESLGIGNTIILSRGLIDVLPDEASLAAILAHELEHILLGHTVGASTTKYGFHDRLMMKDEDVIHRLNFKPSQHDEAAADTKAIELLKNSPYKDQLGQAGLFLRAMADAAPHTPQLFGAHLGSRLAQGNQVRRVAELMGSAPALQKTRVDQIAALPLGARVKVNPWNDHIALMKSKPVTLMSPREKMPFEVTRLFPYLVRFGRPGPDAGQKEQAGARSDNANQQSGDPPPP